MANQISLRSVVIHCCWLLLLVHAESPVNSFSITDNNAYDYTNSIANNGYNLGTKDANKDTRDYYAAGSNVHSLITTGTQGNLGGTLGSTYGGFSPSTQNSGFGGYSSATRDNLGVNAYSSSPHSASSFSGFASGNANTDSTYEGYATGASHGGTSDYSQFSSDNHKNPSYLSYTDSISSGASNIGSFSDVASEASSLRGYSGGSRSPLLGGSYLDSDHAGSGDSFAFNGPSSEYSYVKHKEGVFAPGGSNKYMHDGYPSPSEMRYIRGSQGGVHMGRDYAAQMYLGSGSNGPFATLRGAPSHAAGKLSKYSKYANEYAPNGGLNYPSRDQEADYLPNYAKGNGKVIVVKDGRPSSYGGQGYSGGAQSYLSKLLGNYKNKPSSLMSYSGYSPASLQSSFSSSNYGEGHPVRGYRSSGGYGSVYPGYY